MPGRHFPGPTEARRTHRRWSTIVPLAVLIAAGAIGTAAAGQMSLDKAVASIVPHHETVVYLSGVDRATQVAPVHGRMSWRHRLSLTLDEAGLSASYAGDTVRIGNPAMAAGRQGEGQRQAMAGPGFSMMPYTPPAAPQTPTSRTSSAATAATGSSAKVMRTTLRSPPSTATPKVASLQGKSADELNAEELKRTGHRTAGTQQAAGQAPAVTKAAMPVMTAAAHGHAFHKAASEKSKPATVKPAAARIPAAPAPTPVVRSQPVAPVQTWTLTPGLSYEVELKRWARKAGDWHVHWLLIDPSGSKIDWIVPERVEFTGSFRHVATEIIEDLRAQGATIHADSYPGKPYNVFVVDSPKDNTNAN